MKIIILSLIAISLTGCGRFDQWWSHQKSAMGGLNREAIVYSMDGNVLKKYNFDSQVEIKEGAYRFLVNGKAVLVPIDSTIIEEK